MNTTGGGVNSPKMQEAMKDPEVRSFVEKVTTKLGPLLGMMGGGMGGMGGGMGGMGGAGAGAPPSRNPPGATFDEEVD